jgi:exosome complex RNA-binding protein Csl4
MDMEMKEKIESLKGKEVIVRPKDGDIFLAEVKGIDGDRAILDVIGVGNEGGLELFLINQIDDVDLV